MSAPEPLPAEPGGPPNDPAETTTGAAAAPPPRPPPTRTRVVLLLVLLACVAGWFAYDSSQTTPAARSPAEGVALDAAGGWWNVLGDRYLELQWEGRRATLWDYTASESGVESTGVWRTTDQSVFVQVSGAAGSLAQEYEVVGNDAELFLAPVPAAKAKLFDSWIADHGDDEDDNASPGQSVSREATWRPHRHSQHPHRLRARFGA